MNPKLLMKIDMLISELKKRIKNGQTTMTIEEFKDFIHKHFPDVEVPEDSFNDPLSVLKSFVPEDQAFYLEYAMSKLID